MKKVVLLAYILMWFAVTVSQRGILSQPATQDDETPNFTFVSIAQRWKGNDRTRIGKKMSFSEWTLKKIKEFEANAETGVEETGLSDYNLNKNLHLFCDFKYFKSVYIINPSG